MEPEERAAAEVFLAFQYPVEIPGVPTCTFLKQAVNALRKARGEKELDAMSFLKLVREKTKELGINDEMLKRAVNVGFSGGEKKRNEVLQMAVLEPKLAVLDETDSGLDIDALKTVADGVNACAARALDAGDHPLPTPARVHRARPGACPGPGPHRQVGRQGAGAGARRKGLRRVHGEAA